ncbi:MAG: hypothetical protein ACRD38_02360 [Nitrososphaerales archaeon]
MRVAVAFMIAALVFGISGSVLLLAPNVSASSNVKDAIGDATPSQVYETNIEPTVQDYHDIVGASVKRLNAKELLLTVEVAGDPNQNSPYETVYIWVIDYPTITGNQRYTVIVPHFPPELGLEITGWYATIFDNKANRYVTPTYSVGEMQENKVEVNIDPSLIGSPPLFWWQVYVMVGVDTATHDAPDFLMDIAPEDSVMLLPFT